MLTSRTLVEEEKTYTSPSDNLYTEGVVFQKHIHLGWFSVTHLQDGDNKTVLKLIQVLKLISKTIFDFQHKK